MESSKLDFITARLKAINRISHALDTKDAEERDFKAICRIFVETIGYFSCWISLTDDRGETREFTRHHQAGLLTPRGEELPPPVFTDFVKQVLVNAGDCMLNADPILEHVMAGSDHEGANLGSVTMKLIHNGIIYGVLSVTLLGDYDQLREEVLVIAEVGATIAFFLYDIDSRKKNYDLFLTMFETTGTGVTIIDDETIISYANREFERLSGYTRAEIEGKMSFISFVDKDDAPRMLDYHRLRRIDPDRAPRNYEFRFIDRSGEIKNIDMTIGMVPRTKVSIASYMNVTEKKKLESEILRVSEQERQELGNELHDGMGPHLVGVKMMLRTLRKKVERAELPRPQELAEIESLITSAIENTRTIIKGLKPVDIQPDGLIFAIEELAEATRSHFGIACSIDYDQGFFIGNNITATHLYYIVREAVNNAVKHAEPATIRVSLRSHDDELQVEIDDDGCGMPKSLDSAAGMGMHIMRYRASIIKASIEFGVSESGGTSVICTLPR